MIRPPHMACRHLKLALRYTYWIARVALIFAAAVLTCSAQGSSGTPVASSADARCLVGLGTGVPPWSTHGKSRPPLNAAYVQDIECTVGRFDSHGASVTDPAENVVTVRPVIGVFDRCYAWYAEAFTSGSPYVALYTPDDMNNLRHSVLRVAPSAATDAPQDCSTIRAITFQFPGRVRWVRMWAYPKLDGVAEVSGDLNPQAGAPSASASSDSGLLERASDWTAKWLRPLSKAIEAPGGIDVLGSWTFAPHGIQKWGVFANLQPLFHVGSAEANTFIGASVLMDIDIRTTGALNPDSIIGGFTYAWRPKSINHEIPLSDLFYVPPMVVLQTGLEFARGSNTLNQVTSLTAGPTFVMRKWEPAKNLASFSPIIGTEVGHNF